MIPSHAFPLLINHLTLCPHHPPDLTAIKIMGPDFLFCHASMRRGLLAHVETWGIEKKKAHRNNIIEPNLACYAEVNRESKVNAHRTFVQMMIHIAVTISILECCQG